MNKNNLPRPVAFLAGQWGNLKYGIVTFAVGLVFLLVLSFTSEQPMAFYEIDDPVDEEVIPLEEEGTPPAEGAIPDPVSPTDSQEPLSKTEPVPPEPQWQEYTVAKNDTMGEILGKITDDKEAIQYLLQQKLKSYRRIRPGRAVRYKIDGGNLVELQYKTSSDYYMHFKRTDSGMQVSEDPPRLIPTEVRKSATITSSLYEAMDKVKVGGNAIDGLITALETHIDFYRDLRKGDRFEMIYDEERDEDGELVNTTRPKAFTAFNRGREIVGVYSPEVGGYYTPSGESLQKAFLRSPVKFSRISSKFSLRRLHPVLKVWRAHRGVDYAAPRGTPIRASGDGVVSFAGKKGGYGNVVFIKHYKIYTTVYGHLHRFAKGVKKGKRVAQGQVIGYVGSTGLATGPHLHYEFRVRGKHRDPLSAAVPVQLPPLKGEDLENFKAYAAPFLAKLELYKPEEVALQE